MEYTYEINSENQSINVIMIGNLETKELAAIGLKILLLAKELKYKIVFDCRLSKTNISITDAYYWFSKHYDNIDFEFRRIPTAYIANKEDFGFYSFFECTCMNKGIPIKAFLDENEVSKWLESV